MVQDGKILLGKGENPVYLLPAMANRHGLIAGATGTGKTVTLKVMAEGFSQLGVPVFLADIKGDVSGMALAGAVNDKIAARLQTLGIDPANFAPQSSPCRFWDVLGQGGIPVRATVSDLGPLLLSRLLDLSDAQQGVLNIVFRVADDQGWQLIDFKDLRAMLTFVGEHHQELATTYGAVATQSVGAIQRALLALENAGAATFLGEPPLDIKDWLQTAPDGRGIVNILNCVKLAQQPLLYATFLLWMLGEIYETLPEVGDCDKPKLVFFFDEAHLLFDDAPKALLDKVTQVVKLVRSKGVGIYFITQSPSDIPDEVLSQLNNRIQHALRAYTPAEQKAVRAAAQSFRENPKFKTEDAIGALGTGCALISTLDADGVPCMVEQATVCPPQCAFAGLEDAARAMLAAGDALWPKYKDAVDTLSAYEVLSEQQAKEQAEKEQAAAEKQAEKEEAAAEKAARREERERQAAYRAAGYDSHGRSPLEQGLQRATKSAGHSIGRDLGRQITRGVLGTHSRGAQNAVGSFAGNLVGDLLGNLFK